MWVKSVLWNYNDDDADQGRPVKVEKWLKTDPRKRISKPGKLFEITAIPVSSAHSGLKSHGSQNFESLKFSKTKSLYLSSFGLLDHIGVVFSIVFSKRQVEVRGRLVGQWRGFSKASSCTTVLFVMLKIESHFLDLLSTAHITKQWHAVLHWRIRNSDSSFMKPLQRNKLYKGINTLLPFLMWSYYTGRSNPWPSECLPWMKCMYSPTM